MNDQLDFILTVIKRYYNSNDRLKFILLFIRWENGLNKWLKHVKRGTENKRNENKSMRNKWGPLRVNRMNWKIQFREHTGWRPKNDDERTKNNEESSRNRSWKRLRSVTEVPQLGFFPRKHVFSSKTAEMHSQGG